MSSQRNIDFKRLFVAHIDSPKGNAAQITSQYVKGKIDRQKKEQVSGYDSEMDKRIAHFWDSNHDFWKIEENKKYGITLDSKLPVTYANVTSFKKQVAKVTPDQPVTPPAIVATVATKKSKLSIAAQKLQLQRDLLLIEYKEAVESAQNELKKVQVALDADLTISTQEELDSILNTPTTENVNSLDLEI